MFMKKCIIKVDNIDLIPITKKDFQFGYDLWKLTQKEYIEKIKGEWKEETEKEFYTEELKKNIKCNYLIRLNKYKIGWLEYELFKDYIFLKQLHITPEYQNKGIGAKTINEIINYGRKNKKDIYLEVFQHNDKALNFYTKIGFQKYTESNLFISMEYKVSEETVSVMNKNSSIYNFSETEKSILIYVNYNPFHGNSYYIKQELIKEAKIDPEKAEEALKSLIEKDMAYTKIIEHNLLPDKPKETIYCFKCGMWEDGGFISDLYELKNERMIGKVCP